jgi:AraC family transcriptional regulator, transcriptional activator FtrA
MNTIVKIVPTSEASKRHTVAALAYDGLCTFEFGIVVELFGLPRPAMKQWYDFRVCALESGPLRATGGLSVTPEQGIELLHRAETIVIPGWRDPAETPPARLIDSLRRAHRRGARIVSICSGVFVIAATGLLNGKRATTHWRYTEELARRYPQIRIEPDVLYVDEGKILTSAGSAAGIDLCLHIIRKDFGTLAANQVARRLIMPPHRDGGQAQFIERPVADEDTPWLSKLLEWAERHLAEDLTIARLARQACVSKRTLARRFLEATGTSPADWVIGLRVGRAKELLETTARSVEDVASRSGFGSSFALRHHFRKRLKTSPSAYRSRFRSS